MGYERLESVFDDVQIRQLRVHDNAEITCEAHPTFYSLYWTASISLGAWLGALSSVFAHFVDQPHMVTIYWWRDQEPERISLEDLLGALSRLGPENLEAEAGLVRVDLWSNSLSLAWQTVPSHSARWLVYPPPMHERSDIFSILSETVDSEFIAWLMRESASPEFGEGSDLMREFDGLLAAYKHGINIDPSAYGEGKK